MVVKVRTESERMLRRSLRLQKKLHVGKFKKHMVYFCLKIDEEKVPDIPYAVDDVVYDVISSKCGFCYSHDNSGVDGVLDWADIDMPENYRYQLAEKFFNIPFISKVLISDQVDAWYYHGFDSEVYFGETLVAESQHLILMEK